jgi:hypothetical protein
MLFSLGTDRQENIMLLNEKAASYEKEYRVKRHGNKSIKNIFLNGDHRFKNYMG